MRRENEGPEEGVALATWGEAGEARLEGGVKEVKAAAAWWVVDEDESLVVPLNEALHLQE